ncbi:leucine-rich repeat-containing protein 37A [Dromiciops gliroides]|uniref:leucine-rich repeat-containing protein 37A n=1 Tax=Dromiciops gliroides TaxID=33562 RepID=UPI001CC3E438|nr:leucine-rich repeat-containing protein 37A [Dromiciops gliroides]
MKRFPKRDFHGNSISIIERGIWKSYPWAETLNLKDNALHKLHKDSFEGLLSLQHLDLSCNKIHVIERCAFEPLPFLQFLNLGCNLLKKLSYGTFQAWHGMQLLQKLILSHNPLSAIEDTSFFQLPSLKYLDISRTDVPLMAIENILVMALRLQTLVLPSNTACCLCQFKKNIESLFKTTKLQCESKCFTNSSLCVKYLLPKLLKGQVKSVELKLFPFIKLLHAHSRNGEETSGPSTNPSSWSSFGPIRINLTDEIQLRKLYFVTNLLEAYLREKMYPIQNKREKMVQAKHPTLRKKWNTFGLERGGKCGMAPGKCSQAPASSSGEAAAPTRGLALASAPRADACTGRFCPRKKSVTVGKVSSRERSMGGKHSERTDPQSFQGKWESVESSLEKFAKGRTRASALAMRRLSSRLKKPGWHRVDIPSTAKPLAVSLEDRRKSGGLTYPISASKSVNKRLKYKGQKENHGIGRAFHKDHIPVFRSNKKHFLHKAKSRITNKFPEAKHSQGLKNKLAQNRWLFENPVFTGTRSLINNPSKKDISLSPKRRMPAKASKGTTPAKASEVPPTRNTTSENTPASSKKKEEFTLLGDSLPAVQLTNETRWEHQGNPESLPEPNSNSSFNFSASTDSFEIELNQRLQPLIPNDEMRSLISHVVRTLQKDCREPRVQLACAKLISKTGHLMKLLSDGQKMNQSPAHQNPDPGKQENYLNDSTSLQMALGQLQTDELKKDIPEFGYNNKLLLAISVTVVVMIIIAVVCLIEICSHRPTTSKGDIKYSYSLRSFLTSLHKKSSRRSPEEEGNFYRKGKPLWLRDMYRPLDATRKKNMAQKLHDQDSSDEDEIFNKERRNEAIEKREEKRKNEED